MNDAGPRLRDIRLPQVSWWPPAPGWWMLAGLLSIACAAIVVMWLRHRRRRRPWHTVRRELALLAARHARDRDDLALVAGVSRLLRRIALLVEPDAAASDGAAWRAFLQCRAPEAFDDAQLDALVSGPYRRSCRLDAGPLLTAVRRWCATASRHRTERVRVRRVAALRMSAARSRS